MKTHTAKLTDIKRQWYVLDASEAPLGRLSTVAASLLIGKGKPTSSPHLDSGDYVVVVNAAKLVMTGNKSQGKEYFRHSGFPGGLHRRTLTEAMQQNPVDVVTKAVRGMLPVNKLRPGRLKRLKVYVDTEHKHSAHSPEPVSLKKEDR